MPIGREKMPYRIRVEVFEEGEKTIASHDVVDRLHCEQFFADLGTARKMRGTIVGYSSDSRTMLLLRPPEAIEEKKHPAFPKQKR